jgi:hypothetical protein
MSDIAKHQTAASLMPATRGLHRMDTDKELVPNRIVAAFNLYLSSEIARSRATGMGAAGDDWFGTALMAQIGPDLFVGTEARDLRSCD